MSGGANSIEKVGKAGIRKGFLTGSQFQQAQSMAQKYPNLPFIDLLEKLGFITGTQKKELQDFLQNYDSILATLPSLPVVEEEEESMMLTPLEDEEEMLEEAEEEDTDGLLLATNNTSSALMLAPEPETMIAEASFKITPQEMALLPEAATLPTFQDLLNQLPSVPLEEKFRFAHPEDEAFAKYTIEKNLLSRETIEVMLEIQKNLKKMAVGFSIAQIVKEFNYLDEGLIRGIQQQLKSQITLIRNYTLSKAENQMVLQKVSLLCAKEVLNEAKKVQEYFKRLTLEKSLPEVLLIQGHYKIGDIQKRSTSSSRISSIRKTSSVRASSRVSASLRRSSSSKKKR